MSDTSVAFRDAVKKVLTSFEAVRDNKLLRLRLESCDLRSAVWREAGLLDEYALSDSPLSDLFHVYTAIHAIIIILQSLKQHAVPGLRAELARSADRSIANDRLMMQMTLSGVDANIARIQDSLADLYAATVALDIARHGYQKALRNEFPELADSRTWSLEPKPASSAP